MKLNIRTSISIIVFTVVSIVNIQYVAPVHASDKFGGTSVPVSLLLEDSGCYRVANGTITCGLFGTETTLSSQGALAGKTIVDFHESVNNACAITSEGHAVCWGSNGSAAVGDNTTTNRSIPTAVYEAGALNGVVLTKISTSYDATCAVSNIGRLYCWGYQGGSSNYLRVGSAESYVPPTLVIDTTLASLTWKDVWVMSSSGICGLTTSNLIKCWDRYSINAISTPSLVAGDSLLAIEGAGSTSSPTGCALSTLGNVYCWGSSTYFARISGVNYTSTGRIPFSSVASNISVGDGVVCAVIAGGAVECLGNGYYSTVGLGVLGYPVVGITGTGPGGEVIRTVQTTSNYIYFLRTDGILKQAYRSTYQSNQATNTGDVVGPTTPKLTVYSVDTTSYFGSGGCVSNSISYGVCLQINVDLNGQLTANIYADANATTLEKTVSFVGSNAYITGVDGRYSHWVRVTAINGYGSTTTSLYRTKPDYFAPTVSITKASISSGTGTFTPYVYYDDDDGGLPATITKEMRRSGSAYWGSISSFGTSSIKTSSEYEFRVTAKNDLGVASDTSLVETPNLLRKKSLFRNKRYLLASVFRIDSPGKRTWVSISGCAVRGAYLLTDTTNSCKLRLKIAAAKGYVGSTWTYTTPLG